MKKLYGIPVQVENIALLVNTKLAKVPKTFAQLEATALAVKKKNKLAFGICVQQGSGGDAYHMYPFFSGLGGYVFGVNRAGNLDPSDIGVANPAFLKNAALIDKWNKEGLINSKADYSTCDTAFTKNQAPYWITGPWAVSDIQKAGVKFRAVQVPPIEKASVPFLGVNGDGRDQVRRGARRRLGCDRPGRELLLDPRRADRSSPPPAAGLRRTSRRRRPTRSWPSSARPARAASRCRTSRRWASVWSDLGQAWVRSTKGAGAMPAGAPSLGAARAIAAKIG